MQQKMVGCVNLLSPSFLGCFFFLFCCRMGYPRFPQVCLVFRQLDLSRSIPYSMRLFVYALGLFFLLCPFTNYLGGCLINICLLFVTHALHVFLSLHLLIDPSTSVKALYYVLFP